MTLYLFLYSTCFGHPFTHHQERITVSMRHQYFFTLFGWCLVCRPDATSKNGHVQRNIHSVNFNDSCYTLSAISDNCPLLGYYAASSGNFLPKFRDNLSVPCSGGQSLKTGPIGCPETSVRLLLLAA